MRRTSLGIARLAWLAALAASAGGCDGCSDTSDHDAGIDAAADADADSDADADADTDTDTDTDADTDADAGGDAGPSADGGPDGCDPWPASVGWRFAVFGDSRGSDLTNYYAKSTLEKIATALLSENVEFAIFPGDLVYGSSNATTLRNQLLGWLSTMKLLYDSGIRVYPVRGNHDDASIDAWNEVFRGDYANSDAGPHGEENLTYAIEHENTLILGFDDYVTIHRPNLEWLEEQLAATSAQHVFAFGHEPAFGVVHGDCLDDYPAERDEFWCALAKAGGSVYFAAHDHFYGRALVHKGEDCPDMYQMIVATGGAPPYTFDGYDGYNGDASVEDVFHDTPYGYVIVQIDGPHVRIAYKKLGDDGEFHEVESFCYDDAT
jgi:hypothetical protein